MTEPPEPHPAQHPLPHDDPGADGEGAEFWTISFGTVLTEPDDGPPTPPLVRRGGPPPGGPPAPPLASFSPDPDPEPPPRSRRRTALAVAIADALLADEDWTPGEMVARATVTFAGRQDWLPGLIEQVLDYYPRPPVDRPRELAAVVDILVGEIFDGLWAEARRVAVDDSADEEREPDPTESGEPATAPPIPVPVPVHIPRPIRRLAAPTRTVRHPFATPRLDHVAEVAELLGVDIVQLTALADTALRGRRARSPRIANYRYRWLDRPSGPRLLEAPRSRLLAAQRMVLHSVLDHIPVHPAVHGFVAGRSVVTGAREHVGTDTVLTMDLEHFFAAVTAGRIWGVLRSAGFPEPVAHLLAGLTTTATPVRVIGEMPPGPHPDRRHRLRQRLATPHLPQGSPTSPALANLVAFGLDRRLSAYAGAVGLSYTRYADDLTFSGPFRDIAHVRAFAAAVSRIAAQEGFRINVAKTRWRGRHERQTVTGVVVNEHPAIARDEVDRLRAVLHDCRRSGPDPANRHGHPDFRAHLLGRISWVASVHPSRGARLREQFDGIDWTDSLGGRTLGR